jgi:hypothetical protein
MRGIDEELWSMQRRERTRKRAIKIRKYKSHGCLSEEEQIFESLGQRVRFGKKKGAGTSSKMRIEYYKT